VRARVFVVTLWCWILACCGPSSRALAAPGGKDIGHVADLIEALQLTDAAKLLEELEAAYPASAPVEFQRALLTFYQGDYANAVAIADRAIARIGEAQAPKTWLSTRDLIASTSDATRGYQRETSADGRYSISFPSGEERVLLPYAFDVLATMDRVLRDVVGTPLPGPIRLEIYPSAGALARVSTLTLEQIETSGTVALCKWDRLMITSPRALVRGYPWVDTIAHELTHLYLSFATQERAPVWLQEGTAKLLERRWRDPGASFELDPTSRNLLLRATHDNKLLTFDQLHPSIALLPSQDDATLAFAQVSTFMSVFVTTHGERALRDAFGLIAHGTDAREALGKAAGQRFSELEHTWKGTLPKNTPNNAPRKLARRFKSGGTNEAPDEAQDVAVSEARRFLRIGDLVWSRRHVRAAMFEYEKAHQADSDDPIVAARLARAALEAGDPARSLAALEPLLQRYPEHAPTHAVRGAALHELGRTAEAHASLLEAIRINPFDPDPHCRLQQIASGPNEAEVEHNACGLLRALR
jgi:tetratricopeptide (TPR) repeat protein